jgi:DNA-binding MarR family transcriptional regulator
MLEAGPRTPSELASMLGMPLSTLSTYVGAMLARGDAKRIPNPSDGRSVRIVLTDRGRAVVRTVNPPFTRAVVALEANLDAPVGEVRATLRGILEAIEEADAELASGQREIEADTTSS